jgi:hypothetical protein
MGTYAGSVTEAVDALRQAGLCAWDLDRCAQCRRIVQEVDRVLFRYYRDALHVRYRELAQLRQELARVRGLEAEPGLTEAG